MNEQLKQSLMKVNRVIFFSRFNEVLITEYSL